MNISDLQTALQNELNETGAVTGDLTDDQLERAVYRAILSVNGDFAKGFTADGSGVLSPEPTFDEKELILLAAIMGVANIALMAAAKDAVTWKSGDKSVSHSDEVNGWSRVARHYSEQYARLAEKSGVTALTPVLFTVTGGAE